MSNPDEENQLSQTSIAGQISSASGHADDESPAPAANGYLMLAKLMAEMPTMGMYRRFGILNALSLLFYQAELVQLEREFFKQIEQDDASNDVVKRVLSKDWGAVSATDEQRKIVDRIRAILEKYNEQMLLQHKLVKVDKPRIRDIHYLRTWMRREDMGNVKLQGPDRSVWRKTHLSEIVALDARKPEDALTDWITSFVVDIYHYLIGQHLRKSNLECFQASSLYSDKGVARTVSIAVIGPSSVFPISSILLLNHFKEEGTRMIILCVYTLAFSVILATVSGVKRLEVFSAAAAFAAVQVVFIGQNK